MQRIPAWAWSVLTVALILVGLMIGGRGPEGRAMSRAIFPFAAIMVIAATALSYWQERINPSGRLRLINLATVLAAMYLTVPLWHFGVVLPENPGESVTVRWWVNGVVLILAAGLYYSLSRITRQKATSPQQAHDSVPTATSRSRQSQSEPPREPPTDLGTQRERSPRELSPQQSRRPES